MLDLHLSLTCVVLSLRLAKIRPSGIHFKAIKSPLVYLVDEAGVRTNFSESFMNMERDITLDVLYKDCRHGAMYVNVCKDLLSDIESKVLETGTEWKLYDVSVVQENVHGFIRYAEKNNNLFPFFVLVFVVFDQKFD